MPAGRNMKFLLVLLLSGLACATGSPTCSSDAVEQCFPVDNRATDDDDFKATEEYLKLICKSMGCMKDYNKKCGLVGIHPEAKKMFVRSEKIYDAICGDQAKEMRQKYLKNAKCIIKEVKTFGEKCKVKEGLMERDPEFCPSIAKFMDCTNDLIRRNCGKDAIDVFNAAISFDMEFYGCKA